MNLVSALTLLTVIQPPARSLSAPNSNRKNRSSAIPLIDLFARYRAGGGDGLRKLTLTINDHITYEYEGGAFTWIENLAADRPFGNEVDPTLNLDVLEVSFRNHAKWSVVDPRRVDALRRIILFQFRLVESGAFAEPRSHIYYLPELCCTYFARCHRAFAAMPRLTKKMLDPDGMQRLHLRSRRSSSGSR